MKEADLQRLCMMEACKHGALVWRNNQGAYLKGKHWVKYGVCNPGGSDLIGITKDGKFLALEIKLPGQQATPAQLNFIKAVVAKGGLAAICYTVDDVKNILT
jgi:hypothetical protein